MKKITAFFKTTTTATTTTSTTNTQRNNKCASVLMLATSSSASSNPSLSQDNNNNNDNNSSNKRKQKISKDDDENVISFASTNTAMEQNNKRSKNGTDPEPASAVVQTGWTNEVEELLMYLENTKDTNNNDSNKDHDITTTTTTTITTWKHSLSKHFQSSSFRQLASYVANERRTTAGVPIFPTADNTWTALNVCPLENVKVVIVGQDPYHGINQAHGLCFSVLPHVQPVPPSLKNIYKEIAIDIPTFRRPNHGHLIRWAQQGVLMLNTVMTVRQGQPNAHQKQGWEQVTDEIIRHVLLHQQQQQQEENGGVVFLLWGKPAYKKATDVIQKFQMETKKNNSSSSSSTSKKFVVISTSHPSPLGATKTTSPFIGSRCFSRCNQALLKMGHCPIDWNVDD